jgi:hypothetical protein
MRNWIVGLLILIVVVALIGYSQQPTTPKLIMPTTTSITTTSISKTSDTTIMDFTKIAQYKPEGYNYGEIKGDFISSQFLSGVTIAYRTDFREIIWKPLNISRPYQLLYLDVLEFSVKSEPENNINKITRSLTDSSYTCTFRDVNNYTFKLCEIDYQEGESLFMLAKDRFLFVVYGSFYNKEKIELIVSKLTELLS